MALANGPSWVSLRTTAKNVTEPANVVVAFKLAKALASYKKRQPVVLALPRGGLPIAAEVCTALNAPLDLILVRKIGVPFQPELAMGAVVDGSAPFVVRNEDVIRHAKIDEATFNAICDTELFEIEQRRQRYLSTRDRVEIAGHLIQVKALLVCARLGDCHERPDRLPLDCWLASLEVNPSRSF